MKSVPTFMKTSHFPRAALALAVLSLATLPAATLPGWAQDTPGAPPAPANVTAADDAAAANTPGTGGTMSSDNAGDQTAPSTDPRTQSQVQQQVKLQKQLQDKQQQEQMFGRAPWPAQRVVLLLPLQLGESWNLDKDKMNFLLPIAEQRLQQAMQRSGKFSTTQVHRYNPIFLRGIQDKMLTREQVNAVVAAPTLEAVQMALASMTFDQPPLVALVSMEQVTTQAGEPVATVTTRVTGRLYEAGDPTPIRDVTLESMPAPLYLLKKIKGKTVYVRRSASERVLVAADNAFMQIVREWVKPIDDITLPDPVIAAPNYNFTPAPGTSTPPATLDPSGRPVIRVPQGQVLGTFPTTK